MKAGWSTKPLGDACDWQRGLTYSKSDEVDVSDNIVLRATNIDLATNLLDLGELKYINEKVIVPDSKKVKVGSLIICTASGSKSHLGKVAYIDNDYGYAFGGFMGMLTPKHELNSKFLFHLMTSPAYKDFIAALSDGANINNLKFDDLRQFVIPVPPLPEQQHIVTLLDEAFEGIATAKANAEKNLQNARAIFESHLQSVFNNQGDGWKCIAFEDTVDSACTLSYGIVQPGEEYAGGMPIVRPTDLGGKTIEIEGLKRIDPALAASYRRTTLRGGDLLLCVRGTTGQISIASKNLAGANVTRGIVPIFFEPTVVAQDFGYYLMRSGFVQSQIREKTYGTALQQINIGDLRNLKLPIPPLAKQAALTTRLDELSGETQRLESIYQQKLTALDELKKSMLHRAFNGDL